MTIQNKYGLPQVLVNLFGQQEYSRGAATWSVTSLIAPPKIVVMREAYRREIQQEADISDSFWSLMGTNIHRILQDGKEEGAIVEERVFADIEGHIISGQIDQQKISGNTVRIIDWKFTSVWSVQRPKPEWEAQLNLYAYLLRKVKGLEIEGVWVCAILKDWKKMDLQRRKEYPPLPIMMMRQPLWSYEQQEAYATKAVKSLVAAQAAFDLDEPLQDCSDEDRWLRDGTNIRCEHFCDVSQWCQQWKEIQAVKVEPAPAPVKKRAARKPKEKAVE